jgi:hypothetical protein
LAVNCLRGNIVVMRAGLSGIALSLGRRRVVAVGGGALVAALVLATVAVAQPRGARPIAARPSSASPSPSAPGGAAPAPPAAPAGESGPVPAPPSAGGDAGTRGSPLNPAPNEFSDAGAPASVDYDHLLTDLASLRARAAAVSDVLFHSRVAVTLQASGDHGRIAALSVGLDDGTVWTAPIPFRADDPLTVYEHAVAPGRHAVTVDVERRDDRDDTFRTTQRSRFAVDVPVDARLSVDLRLGDDSTMGADFPGDRKGQYDLRVRAQARAQPLAQGK